MRRRSRASRQPSRKRRNLNSGLGVGGGFSRYGGRRARLKLLDPVDDPTANVLSGRRGVGQ